MKPNALISCQSKKYYNSEAEALKQSDFLASTKNVFVDVYKCNICEGWHLTSMKNL